MHHFSAFRHVARGTIATAATSTEIFFMQQPLAYAPENGRLVIRADNPHWRQAIVLSARILYLRSHLSATSGHEARSLFFETSESQIALMLLNVAIS